MYSYLIYIYIYLCYEMECDFHREDTCDLNVEEKVPVWLKNK